MQGKDIDDGVPTAATNGADLAVMLAGRYPGRDWLAALAKGAVMPRADVERHMQSTYPPPGSILRAIEDLDQTLDPGDPGAGDDVFAADTNDDVARMEVDAEAGMTVSPAPKTSPSRSGSPHEMGEDKARHPIDDA